jgi:hypothetical protein
MRRLLILCRRAPGLRWTLALAPGATQHGSSRSGMTSLPPNLRPACVMKASHVTQIRRYGGIDDRLPDLLTVHRLGLSFDLILVSAVWNPDDASTRARFRPHFVADLRGIILNDDKSSTYKLALLRAILQVADGTPSLAVELPDDDAVDLPLGLVALNWLRMFLPLVSARLPQSPGNSGPEGLGFAREGFRALAPLGLVGQELRYGNRFSGERASAVARALMEAARTIERMPVNFTRYPNSSSRIFEAASLRGPRARGALLIDNDLLTSYGVLRVPGHVWRAMQRMGAWIEPVLIAEWARMMRNYAERMGLVIKSGEAETSLTWIGVAGLRCCRREVAGSQVRIVMCG